MGRLRANFIQGIITNDNGGSPIGILTDTTSPSSFATLPVVSTPGDYIPITINPTGVPGSSTGPEIVYVISHASGADSVSVIRACENTSVPTSPWSGVSWVEAYTRDDYLIDSNLVTNGDFIGVGASPIVKSPASLGNWTSNSFGTDANEGTWTFSATGSNYLTPPFGGGGATNGSYQSAHVEVTDAGQGTLGSNPFPVFPGEVIEVTGFVWLTITGTPTNPAALVSIAQSTNNASASYAACSTTTLPGTPTYHLGTVPVAVANTGGWVPFCITSVMNGTGVLSAFLALQVAESGTGTATGAFAHINVWRKNANQVKLAGSIEPFFGGFVPLGFVLAQAQTLPSSVTPSTIQPGATYGNLYNHTGSYVVFDGAGRNIVGTGTSTSSGGSYTVGQQVTGASVAGAETVTLTGAQSGTTSHVHAGTALTATSTADSTVTQEPVYSLTDATLTGVTSADITNDVTDATYTQSPTLVNPTLNIGSGTFTAPTVKITTATWTGNTTSTSSNTTGVYLSDGGHLHVAPSGASAFWVNTGGGYYLSNDDIGPAYQAGPIDSTYAATTGIVLHDGGHSHTHLPTGTIYINGSSSAPWTLASSGGGYTPSISLNDDGSIGDTTISLDTGASVVTTINSLTGPVSGTLTNTGATLVSTSVSTSISGNTSASSAASAIAAHNNMAPFTGIQFLVKV